ncbi:MAG: M24 family metallopeptidase [Dehalococcoidia bacterium]|nr:M24 family metallopeptidase [Dehalococcoidia bacterium]
MSVHSLLSVVQDYLRDTVDPKIDAWLVHDYHDSNPAFRKVLGQEIGMITRPAYLYMPSAGEPVLVCHHVDAGKFDGLDIPLAIYRSRRSMVEELGKLLPSGAVVAMEYSPLGTLPRASKVDAGTVELVRSLGAEVESSADLVQHATQRWTELHLASHKRASAKLHAIVTEAFRYIGQNLSDGPTEFQVAEFIRRRFAEEGLVTADGPIVATNEHASDPHYEPLEHRSRPIVSGDWVLIDLWAKEDAEDSTYGDITWVAYVGDIVGEEHQRVFDVVTGARDEALSYLASEVKAGRFPQGFQADEAARRYIADRGYGEYFTHRLGHSISHEVHGDAVNLDSFETEDTRRIVPGICFSVEPGIYLPEFGVRSEIDVYMSEEGPQPTTEIQRDVVLIKP